MSSSHLLQCKRQGRLKLASWCACLTLLLARTPLLLAGTPRDPEAFANLDGFFPRLSQWFHFPLRVSVVNPVQDVKFSPSLPEEKVSAHRHMGLCSAVKVILKFDRPILPPLLHGCICSESFIPEFWFRYERTSPSRTKTRANSQMVHAFRVHGKPVLIWLISVKVSMNEAP